MRIHLPNSAFLGNIDPFIRSYDPSDSGVLSITANEKWISIHPMALAIVAALGHDIKPRRVVCQKLTAKSSHYLKRMRLFDFLGVSSEITITEHEPAGRFIPLTQVTNSKELTKFITDMIPLLHLKPEHAEPIKYIVSELIQNVLEHSESEFGAIVAAQYYQKSNTIRIGIVDTGVGIKKTISRTHSVHNHLEAIRMALIPGITGTTSREGGTEFNAGAGLFFIKSIAKVNKNFFVIYSGDSLYKLLKPTGSRVQLFADPFDDRHSKDNKLPFWNGTAVGIDINLDSTEQFSALLDLINKVYIKTVRERKKAKFRRPRFV